MRKHLIIALVVFLSAHMSSAQQWTPLGPDDNNWPCDLDFGTDAFGVDPDGNPVIALRNEYPDRSMTLRRWNGSHWYTFGPVGFGNSNSYPCLAIDQLGGFYVAYMDGDNGSRISVRKWNDGAWQLVGTAGFTLGQASPTCLEVDANGKPVVAFRDYTQGSRASVWHWTGTSWEPVGSPGFSAGTVEYLDMVLEGPGNPIVAYQDNATGKRTSVQRWSGSAWEYVGVPGFSPDSADHQRIVLDAQGNPLVVYEELGVAHHEALTVQRWDGGSWSFVGDRGFVGTSYDGPWIALDPSGAPVVASVSYSFSAIRRANVRRWDGTSWEQYGTSEGPEVLFGAGLALDPSGNPITVFTNLSYGYRTTVQKWTNGSWVVLGDLGFSGASAVAELEQLSLALDPAGKPTVAYADGANYNRLTVQKWNGFTWEQVGPAGFAYGGSSSCLAIGPTGDLYVAHEDVGGKATVHRWNGSSWSTVGAAQFSGAAARNICLAIAPSGDPVIAYQDVANGSRTTVQRWNGSTWELIGPAGFTSAAGGNQCLVFGDDGTPFVACIGAGIRVYRWDGSAWQALGLVSSTSHPYPKLSLTLDRAGHPIVAYLAAQFGASGGATVKRWSGANWELIGPQGLTSVYANSLCLALDTTGAPLLAYRDSDANGGVTVLRWDQELWGVIGSSGFTGPMSAEARRWMAVDAHGRIVVAYVTGGAYAKAYPDADYGIVATDDVLNLGPNPSNGRELGISLGGLPLTLESVEVELHDMSGRRVSGQLLPVAHGELNTRFALPPGLASGMYVASVYSDGSRWSARLIVAKP